MTNPPRTRCFSTARTVPTIRGSEIGRNPTRGSSKRLASISVEPLALVDIRAGNLRALGVTTKKRSPLLPEVPTIAEAGVSGFDYPIWYGVWVPAGTPPEVVDKLAKDIARTLATPEVRDELVKHGADPMSMSQPEFARFVLTESESAARIIKAAGIK